MTTVATVYRSGGNVYDERWVYALQKGVREWCRAADFVCLTDVEIEDVDTVSLEHEWPGWWSKVELFRPGVFSDPVLYMDLDTLPVGWLLDLLSYDGPLAVLSDFYRPRIIASGVMAFTPGARTADIYERFRQSPEPIMRDHRARSDYWYAKVMGEPDRLQELYPGQIVSYKAHARDGIPAAARLVCGHGNPRFSHPDSGWAHEMWAERAGVGAFA